MMNGYLRVGLQLVECQGAGVPVSDS